MVSILRVWAEKKFQLNQGKGVHWSDGLGDLTVVVLVTEEGLKLQLVLINTDSQNFSVVG